MRRYLTLLSILFVSFVAFAQKTAKVESSYIYRCTGDVSVEQAKRIALERAQLESIANTFGTKISQQNLTTVSNSNGKSDVDFKSFSSSDVQGEWIETYGEPEYNISYEQEMLIVKCQVKGLIREVTTAKVDLSVKILRNGIEDKFESSEFKSGDDLFLSFQSPVDGYLAVYLVDNDGNAFCLLPYRNQTDGIYKVKANQRYVFFSEKSVPMDERSIVDEYTMTAEKEDETNQLVIAFSPNLFFKVNDLDKAELLPREASKVDFQKWQSKIRKKDNQLQIINNLLTIKTK